MCAPAARRHGWLLIAVTLVLFQASDISLRLASAHTHFAAGAALQAVPLLLAALAAAALRHRRLSVVAAPPARSWLPAAAAYGSLQFVAGNVLFYAAVQLGGLSMASPAVQSQAIWAVLLGGLFLREPISRTMLGGIGLFVGGIAAMAGYKAAGAELAAGWAGALLCGMAGGLAWAAASAVQRSQLRRGVPLPHMLAAGSATGIVLLNAIIFFGYGTYVWHSLTLRGALGVVAAGCFSGLALWSISHALRTIAISKAIPVISLSIVCNTIIGGVCFGEYVNAGSVCGMLAAFVGVVVVQEPAWLLRRRGARDKRD